MKILYEPIDPGNFLDMSYTQLSFIMVIGIIGMIFIVWAIANLRKSRWLRTLVSSSFGGLLLALAGMFVLFLSNLYTYQRLTSEREIAELSLLKTGLQQYQASLFFLEQNKNYDFELNGDEWQIDARILKWKYPVIWLGLDSHYQLDRIGGRYRDIQQEKTALRTVYSLKEPLKIDIWPIIREYQSHLPWIDALYGSATYLPMRDGARFKISISQTGLIARPVNEKAEDSLSTWH